MHIPFKKQLFCAFAAALAAGASLAGTLHVATEGTFAPFEFYDSKSGELVGFELDLVKAMAAKLGDDVEIEPYKFDAILPAVITGTIDFAAAGFAVTEERAKKVLFTEPFYQSGLTIIVPEGNPAGVKDYSDLEGKRISVQLGSISHDKAKTIKDAKITTFESSADAMLNLISGNADAVINAAPATDYMLVQRPALKGKVVRLDILSDGTPMAMVTSKGKPELRDKLNQALEAIKADGTYSKIHEKWFGRPAQ